MTLFLERGHSVPQILSPTDTRVFSGDPFISHKDTVVIFLIQDPGCIAYQIRNGKREAVKLRKKGHLFISEDVVDGHHLVFGKTRWFEHPNLSHVADFPAVYVPTHGWCDGEWCDGPMLQWDKQGEIAAYVPVGLPAVLQVSSEKAVASLAAKDLAQDVDWEKAKGTLVTALRERFHNVQEGFLLYPRQFDLKEALLIVLFRAAFPRLAIRANAMPEDDRAPIWRRLLQNCGVLHGRAPQQLTRPEEVNLKGLHQLLPDHLLAKMVEGCNRISTVIPPKLLSPLP